MNKWNKTAHSFHENHLMIIL